MTGKACATCGRSGLVLSGGRCGTCNARSRQQPCTACKNVLPVSTRTETGAALCGTCARRRTAHRLMTELHHTAATTLTAWLPTLDEDVILAAVGRAAPNFRQAAWLVGALTDVEVLHASTTVVQSNSTVPTGRSKVTLMRSCVFWGIGQVPGFGTAP